MSDFPSRARCVVIGCGIVGNSLVHHLARLGWTDVVQIDKGPLPNPGGSTGHASNWVGRASRSLLRELLVEAGATWRSDLTLTKLALARPERNLYSVDRPSSRSRSMRKPTFETDVVTVLCTPMAWVVSFG